MKKKENDLIFPVYKRMMTDRNTGDDIEIELTSPQMVKKDEWSSTASIYVNGEKFLSCEIGGTDGFQCFLLSVTYLQIRLDHISSNLSFNKFIKGHGLPAYDLSVFNDFSSLKKENDGV